jgi:hypothetical protein
VVTFPPTIHPPRCSRCQYVLTGLPEPRCPECGQEFDPDDPATYRTKPPFVFWRFWFPPLVMTGVACALWALLLRSSGVGFATTLVVPFALGGLIGYGSRSSVRVLMPATPIR